MVEKDITEKILEEYNDVFADTVNDLLFEVEEVLHLKHGRLIYFHTHNNHITITILGNEDRLFCFVTHIRNL